MPGFMVRDLGRGANSRPVPFYKYTWEIETIFGDLGTSVPLIYARDVTLPSWDFGRGEIKGGSLSYKYAKDIVFNDVKITWYDVVGLAAIIRKWREKIWTPANGLQAPTDYKTNSIITPSSYNLDSKVSWLLIGSWPQNVSSSDLSYTDSELKLITVTVAYDWAEENPD